MAKSHISILEYYERLQIEYIIYELRLKIYPSSKDKAKFRDILEYKQQKIFDISDKNDLKNMFESKDKRQEIESKVFNEFGNPFNITKKDKYFYYFLNTDFSYKGEGVKLSSYNLDAGTAVIRYKNDTTETVDINFIRRIL